MTMAEIQTPARPVFPTSKPARSVDLRAGAGPDELPDRDRFFADLNLGPDTLDQLKRSLPDTLRWAQMVESARAVGDEARAKIPSVKTILGWVNACRAVSMGDPEKVVNVPYGLQWRAIWNIYRASRDLTIEDMRESHGHEATDAFALRMAEYTHQSLVAWLETREAQRARKLEQSGAVDKARAELLAARFKDALPQLERFADALSAAGRKDEAGEVRRTGASVLRRLISGDTFHRLVRE